MRLLDRSGAVSAPAPAVATTAPPAAPAAPWVDRRVVDINALAAQQQLAARAWGWSPVPNQFGLPLPSVAIAAAAGTLPAPPPPAAGGRVTPVPGVTAAPVARRATPASRRPPAEATEQNPPSNEMDVDGPLDGPSGGGSRWPDGRGGGR